MIEFLRKFQDHGIKIAWVNLILITKSTNLQLFTLILYGVRGLLWCIFKLTASAQSINREVYDTDDLIIFYAFQPHLLILSWLADTSMCCCSPVLST